MHGCLKIIKIIASTIKMVNITYNNCVYQCMTTLHSLKWQQNYGKIFTNEGLKQDSPNQASLKVWVTIQNRTTKHHTKLCHSQSNY